MQPSDLDSAFIPIGLFLSADVMPMLCSSCFSNSNDQPLGVHPSGEFRCIDEKGCHQRWLTRGKSMSRRGDDSETPVKSKARTKSKKAVKKAAAVKPAPNRRTLRRSK